MKILRYLLLFLLIPSVVFGATLVFKTGFESTVALNDWTSGEQTWDPGTDGVTGYHVPNDFPGWWRNTLDAYLPKFNFVENCSTCLASIVPGAGVGGSNALKLEIADPDGDARLSLELRGYATGADWDNFNKTCIKFDYKLSAAPTSWFVMNEWRVAGGGHHVLLMYTNPLRWMWQQRPAAAQSSPSGAEVPINEYFQMIVFFERGNPGRTLIKQKRADPATEEVLFDSTPNNESTGGVYSYHAIKHYGSNTPDVYIDNLSFFDCDDADDLPAWDTDIVVPVVTVEATDATAQEEGPTTGYWTIKCEPACAGETITFVYSGTADIDTDYNTDDEDGTKAITGASATITLTPVDDSELDPGQIATLTIQSGTGYSVGGASSDSISIEDNDDIGQVVVSGMSGVGAGTGSVTYDPLGSGGWSK